MAVSRKFWLSLLVLQLLPWVPKALAGIAADGPLRIEYPDVGQSGPIRISAEGKPTVADNWYVLISEDGQGKGATLTSQGAVVEAKVEPLPGGGTQLRIVRQADGAGDPKLGAFELIYELRGADGMIRHSGTFTPRPRADGFLLRVPGGRRRTEAGGPSVRLHGQ
ncbi:MAG: hypothetical protein NTW86_24135 [Candidatus Sumerlaeota bacterium]|nr:hypothetical protein [Candidatus Sumerlaeota bacterium]